MSDKWLSIDTAPKDGTVILLYRPTAVAWMQVAPGMWDEQRHNRLPKPFWKCWLKIGGDYESRNWSPTHWMPLPPPPEPEA